LKEEYEETMAEYKNRIAELEEELVQKTEGL
jgi:hypothetical protein